MQKMSINIKIMVVLLIYLFFGFAVNALTYTCCTLIGWQGEFGWLWDSNMRDFNEMIRFFASTTGLPYIVLGILWLVTLRNEKVEYYNYKRTGLIGVSIGVAMINVLLYSSFYLDMLIGDMSSTGGLVFIFFPFYAVIFGGIGYAVGYIISLKIDERRKRTEK
jgi:branched-subunit amino acid transport protein AzlD